jgi:hypothetical protein
MTRTFLRLLKATSQAALVTLALVPRPAPAPPILYEADLDIVSFEVSSAPETVQIGELFEITLQKVVKNNGDDGPIDGYLTFDATAPLGSSISPTEITELVEDLAVGEQRTIYEIFEATLYDVGLQTFTFTNVFSLTEDFINSGWRDPDPGNNSATLSVNITAVPEPTTLALLSLGLVGLGFTRRRMKV